MHPTLNLSLCTRCARSALQVPRVRARYSTSAALHDRPFRVAVIGSGPAGFYAAYRLLSKSKDAVVDMYEQLPVPFGLVRYGVAPDHPEVKVFQRPQPVYRRLVINVLFHHRIAKKNSPKSQPLLDLISSEISQ